MRGQLKPEQSQGDEGDADHPDPDLDSEGEKEAGQEAGPGDGARVVALVVGELEGGEVGDAVVEQDGEGTEGPGDVDIADEDEGGDDGAHDEDGDGGAVLFLVEAGGGAGHVAAAAHGEEDAGEDVADRNRYNRNMAMGRTEESRRA